jgi:uncharacterized protein (TIGR01619 family)
MPDQWRPYLTNVNYELASIRVNLALGSEAPIRDKPWLLWAWLYFQSPRADGLSSSDEAPTLWAIEDALTTALSASLESVFCGCITTLGRREFYFYAGNDADTSPIVEVVLKNFPQYKIDTGSQRDEQWDQYLNVLYPSEDQLDSIANSDTLEVMSKEGDIHELPREVAHWLYFADERQRETFLHSARATGFLQLDLLPPSGDDRLTYGVVLTETHAITSPEIDRKTRELRALAAAAGGEYDGWEAQVAIRTDSLQAG